MFKDTQAGKEIKVEMLVANDGTVSFDGLPKQLDYPINSFSDEELKNDTLIIFQSIIRNEENF